MMKHSLMALTMCAALALAACDNDTAEETGSAPAAQTDDMVTLPDGMPPQPEVIENDVDMDMNTDTAEPAPETATMSAEDDRTVTPPETGLAARPSEEAATRPLPESLKRNGAPIEPLCFLQTWEQSREDTLIQLDNCLPADYSIVTDSQYEPGPGRYGTAYRPAVTAEDWPGYAFVEYSYLGNQDAGEIIAVVEAGEGSGIFSSLYRVNRTADNVLSAEMIAGGDRCHSGVDDAYIAADGTLNYSQNQTPMALYVLGGGQTENLPASNDLPDCAVCCYGQAHFNNGTMTRATLSPDAQELIGQMVADNEGETETVGDCFDRLTLAHIEAGITSFTAEQLNRFAREVETNCLTANTEDAERAEEIMDDITLPDAPPEEVDPSIDLDNDPDTTTP